MRVGVIGVGRLGSFFARILAENPSVADLILAGSRPDSGQALAGELGGIAGTADQVFGTADAIVIAASTETHPELISRAAEAGVPTFCEKPLGLDLTTTDAAIERVKGAGIELQVGFQRRFDAGYVAARELVGSGGLGDLYLVRAASHDAAPSPESFIVNSGGLYRDLVIHDIDAVRFVTGREIEEVFAIGTAGHGEFEPYQRHGDVGLGVGAMRLDGEVMAVFSASRHNPAGHDVRMELHGSKASVAVGWDARLPLSPLPSVSGVPAATPYRDFLDRFSAAYRAEMQAFLALAEGSGANHCPPEEARVSFLGALALDRSQAEGRPVRLSEFS